MCCDCGFRFIVNPAFENANAPAKIISLAIDLYFKGVSLRKIEDHVQQACDVKVSDSSVCRWIRRFRKVVQPYVDRLCPHRSAAFTTLMKCWYPSERRITMP